MNKDSKNMIDFNKITEALEKSSQEIKDLMFSAELGDKLYAIADLNNLDEEKTLQMIDEAGYVILGLKPRFSFVDSLVEIGIEKNVAKVVADKVEKEIFSELNKTPGQKKEIWFSLLSDDKKVEVREKLNNLLKNNDLEKISSELSEYKNEIPRFAFDDKTWTKRVGEIVLKYSLTPDQSTVLQNLILFVLIGVEDKSNFTQTVEKNLNISNLLAEQISKEIEVRVFQYVENLAYEVTPSPTLNEVKSEPIKESPIKEEHTDFDVVRSMSKDIEYIKNNQDPVMHNIIDREAKPTIVPEVKVQTPPVEVVSNIPEVRPENTPMIEKDITPVIERKVGTIPHNLPGMEVESNPTANTAPEVKIDDLGDKLFVGSGFMQQSTIAKPPVPESTKVEPPKWGSNVNGGSTATDMSSKPADTPEKIGVPRYTSDPYREPIE